MRDKIRNDGLTGEEGCIMDALVSAWNIFVKLERQYPGEVNEFGEHINKCQDLLALRVIRRDYPEGWPTKYRGTVKQVPLKNTTVNLSVDVDTTSIDEVVKKITELQNRSNRTKGDRDR